MTEHRPSVAERLFALRCSEAGVSCNRSSEQDDGGWDYIVQYPADLTDRRPRDEQASGATVFVQVKSTGKPPYKVQLKLSNALRMAKERLPFFLVLVEVSGGERKILARHFWAEEIEHTLRRVRQAEAAGDRDRLHKRTITLTLLDGDDHSGDLLDWMRATIFSIRGDYPAAKALIAKTVGYGESAIRITASFNGSRDEIADWELGSGPTPKITNFAMVRERFGIELPDPTLAGDNLVISAKPVGQSCLATLRHSPSGGTVTLSGKIYFSSLATPATGSLSWRADLGCFDLTHRDGHLDGRIHLDFHEDVTLARLKNNLTIAGWSGSGEVTATLFVGAERAEVGTLDFAGSDGGDEWRELSGWTGTLVAMAGAHPGVAPGGSINDLYDARRWLKRFHDLFAAPTLRIEHPPSPDDDPTDFILYFLRCDVGAWSYFALVRRPVGVDAIVDGRRTLYLQPAELLDGYVFEGSWTDNIDRARSAYARQVEAAGDPRLFWDLGDMEDWLNLIAPPPEPLAAAPT